MPQGEGCFLPHVVRVTLLKLQLSCKLNSVLKNAH